MWGRLKYLCIAGTKYLCPVGWTSSRSVGSSIYVHTVCCSPFGLYTYVQLAGTLSPFGSILLSNLLKNVCPVGLNADVQLAPILTYVYWLKYLCSVGWGTYFQRARLFSSRRTHSCAWQSWPRSSSRRPWRWPGGWWQSPALSSSSTGTSSTPPVAPRWRPSSCPGTSRKFLVRSALF